MRHAFVQDKDGRTPLHMTAIHGFYLRTETLIHHGESLSWNLTHRRSQNNFNVVYCYYKETKSSYSEITEHILPHSMFNVGFIYI